MAKQPLIIFTLLMFFIGDLSQASPPDPTLQMEKAIAQEAQSIASRYAKMGWFSGSLLVSIHNKVIYQDALGYQDIQASQPNTPETKYNLGSIAKDFTKVLVFQQIERGNLSLDDKLAKFKLGFPHSIASQISLRHLLNHRSGFADIFNAEYRQNPLKFDSLQKKLQLLLDDPLLFKPGTKQRYSNYGYIVLGAVLEKVTGQSYETLLKHNIFQPLKLRATSLYASKEDKTQSIPYTFLYNNTLEHVGVTEHPGPDGGIQSNIFDLRTFYRALFYTNQLLNPENPQVRAAFAMNGEAWASYGGGLGVSAAAEIDLKNQVEVIVLANTDQLVAERISGRIKQFIQSTDYADIMLPPENFAYSRFKQLDSANFYNDFDAEYNHHGYTQFIGKTINVLGMQLIKARKWEEAFAIFAYLVHLFPDAPQVYDSLAYAYFSNDQKDKAKEVFKQSLAIQADFQSEYVSHNYHL
ncbi:serine hydrolase [Alteromonas ponticola]|uniref:Serine hydrolase n=1 Tax=Alteromonas aquimaris TaxID=2998417 RepID=A0ABT3P9J9_9ALTE|nr:serine hydrolase [Alteromonas aquimaris]MCW8109447.1 serine hydrolase [Alteromonas aquimaris]